MDRSLPDWFSVSEKANPEIMRRVSDSVNSNQMSLQVRFAPRLAHWFSADALLLANMANRDGMHANSLALMRQCFEAIGVIELGICRHPDAETMLLKWDADDLTPGKLRAWLQNNVWPNYGSGIWSEPWSTFMREFSNSLQPYAHYGSKLAQWQVRLQAVDDEQNGTTNAFVAIEPRAYDAQKATRITMFHSLLVYTLGRIWSAANPQDVKFSALIRHMGDALGRSRYLDGHQTDWGQQFWAMLWERGGRIVLE